MRIARITYWIATVAVCAIMMYSAQMYFRNPEMVKGFFKHFQYPEYIVIPLAIAKVLAVVMLIWRGIPWLVEWAYAGLFFDVVLAAAAHYTAGDSISFTMITLLFLLISYFSGKLVRPLYE